MHDGKLSAGLTARPVTAGELAPEFLPMGASTDMPVMLRVLGEVFTCSQASLSFEGGHYVLMLDGETSG